MLREIRVDKEEFKMANKYIKAAKDVMKVGILSGAGHMAVGSLASMPGMPAQAQSAANLAHTGINIAGVGQLMKTAQTVVGNEPKKKSKKKELMGWL